MVHSIPPSIPSDAWTHTLERESTFIERPVARKPNADARGFKVGDTLSGTYEIRALLGEGGMGQVFEAHDHVLMRTVAIKALWSHLQPGSLLQEGRALAALGGRGVPSVYAMGTHEGTEYCVMERLYGRTLASYMYNRLVHRNFDIAEAIDLMIGIADALVEVHDAGLIHRDLKPANIMLTPSNRTVLFDFGLFLTQDRTGNETSLCGSPRYLAPEAITATVERGQAHLMDIYSLGIIGFLLITGRHPFNERDPARILWHQVQELPPRISTLRPDVPKRLERLISEMLAKDPTERPFSADSVAAELGTIRSELYRNA